MENDEHIFHQADICHAYQLLRKNGLKDENIIVFMYDDIAFDPENPRPGVIINHPQGSDVYHGVPKVIFVNNFFIDSDSTPDLFDCSFLSTLRFVHDRITLVRMLM